MRALTKEGLAFEPAITFQDVWVGFDEGQVLRGVTFQVQERETLILLGETGSGKTLTFKIAASNPPAIFNVSDFPAPLSPSRLSASLSLTRQITAGSPCKSPNHL